MIHNVSQVHMGPVATQPEGGTSCTPDHAMCRLPVVNEGACAHHHTRCLAQKVLWTYTHGHEHRA